ncbi:hypothetical protein T01_9245 [Trichinella spiralis]|uniref:Uncharacterized protein n=1 Tax=Trichinella spiralis TaxID=6334 RepID=A0A0V1BXH5_TRISP|nr:hypothetical protein T01_9245 [Trichinella spiralis]
MSSANKITLIPDCTLLNNSEKAKTYHRRKAFFRSVELECTKCIRNASRIPIIIFKSTGNHLLLPFAQKHEEAFLSIAYQQSVVDGKTNGYATMFFEFHACSLSEMFRVTDRIAVDDIPGVLQYFDDILPTAVE